VYLARLSIINTVEIFSLFRRYYCSSRQSHAQQKIMTSDLWSQPFCLTCEKQIVEDGRAYCSERCRLVDSKEVSQPCHSQVGNLESYSYLARSSTSQTSRAGDANTSLQRSSTVPDRNFPVVDSQSGLSALQNNCSICQAGRRSNDTKNNLIAYALCFEKDVTRRLWK
jgi:hypothetical protein